MTTLAKTICKLIPVFFLFFSTTSSILAAGPLEPPLNQAVRESLRVRLETSVPTQGLSAAGDSLLATAALPEFYQQRLFHPAWIHDGRPGEAAAEILEAIRQADLEGLVPEHYHLEAIEKLLARISADIAVPLNMSGALADLDLLLTDAFLVLSSHYLNGRINPATVDPEWHARRNQTDPVPLLQSALETGRIRETLQGLLPGQAEYAGLRQALEHYRKIAAAGGWPRIAEGVKLQKGDRGPRVAALRERLAITADLDAELVHGDIFDSALNEAVLRFQRRHGLTDDGVVGKGTLAALNLPAEDRVRQIEVNLERWRWLPRDLGERHILVNIADFHLWVREKSDVVLEMRVVVGKPYRRTPVFSGRMTYLVLNPYWQVPHKLAVEDILPMVKKDPNHLEKINMKVFQGWGADAKAIDPATINWRELHRKRFPYRLRQDPGPINALGRIKFMLPNQYDIYLHDTPAKELFRKDTRTFSSGCIRLEKPLELAEYLLRGSRLEGRQAISDALQGAVDRIQPLPQPIPVHLLYWTSWVEQDGTVQFRQDIYERDQVLDAALSATPPAPEA
ncbi:peptidoglycan-binding protein [Desulfuromonas versatilis]|uniref:Peptidoglycan-binding protein n=1 Tax=Desulfuromonas versatilis TaxID=2802975 RepID=A0ABM8HYS8_9BACT|nr:L,D-transpeptidase family protein [Desulfuromonas versatilis]BCR06265.1 peptidoglycan-binding protein [Desulfuromonas versatilis]